MKNTILSYLALMILASCSKGVKTEKFIGSDNKLKYIYETKDGITTIFDYDTNGKLMMKLKFQKDQFIDTIYYYDFNQHYSLIDSSKGKYFYVTDVILFEDGKYGYKGPLRYTKNLDPMKVAQSRLRFGRHRGYNKDGSLNDDITFEIRGDSSYAVTRMKK